MFGPCVHAHCVSVSVCVHKCIHNYACLSTRVNVGLSVSVIVCERDCVCGCVCVCVHVVVTVSLTYVLINRTA